MTVAGRKHENESNAEDSSYDSDYEDAGTAATQPDSQVSRHPDVSRTPSDTLAAEFAEYVTVGSTVNPIVDNIGYTARVEFALKLGYTEKLVQTALEKLGPAPEQNELLAELIKLGAAAGCSQRPEDKGNEESFEPGRLRPVVIDGSNVAMSHGNKEVFSCRGIKICVEWFRARGHREVTVFVPKWRKEASRIDNPVADQEILGELERDRLLVFTPSRLVGGKRMVCYDDRYILKLAAEVDGIVVSNDNYRDLAQENPEFRRVVEERILMYTFVNDRFMPPDDPLGRSGPTLDNFLRVLPRKSDPAPPCPYAKKCTYGNKCKFRHPERGPHPQKSVTEKLVEHVQRHLQHQPLCKAKSAMNTARPQPPTVSKSKSVENVTVDHPAATSSRGVNNNPCCRGTEAAGNSHKKLQRQLTLNPVCDPRLPRLRGAAPAQHRPLTRHSSHEAATFATGSRRHLSRIASAPDSYRAFLRSAERFGASGSGTERPPGTREFLDARSKIHYHLANIFPEEHVANAMMMMPFETDAVEICLAILNTYPQP